MGEMPLYPHNPRFPHALYPHLDSSPGVSNLNETPGLVGTATLAAFPGTRYWFLRLFLEDRKKWEK